MGRTIQIRASTITPISVLQSRAAADHLSLAAYLRKLLKQMASKRTMAEILEDADRRRASGVHVAGRDIIAAVQAVRDAAED